MENQTDKALSSVPSSAPTLSESSRENIKGTRWEAMDNQIDDNLSIVNIINIVIILRKKFFFLLKLLKTLIVGFKI